MSGKREKKQSKTKNNNLSQRKLRLQKKQKPMIGIDIGSSTIEIVQMKKNGKLKCMGMDAIPEGMVNQGRVEAVTPLASVIRRLVTKNNIKGSKCSLCISSNELIVRELKLPEMSEAQIYENIQHEITGFLPLKQEEYCIDYKILEYLPSQDNTPGKLRLMVATIPNSLVRTYINTLKKAKLKVVQVDIAPNVVGKIAKWIMQNNESNMIHNNICFIDFGSRTTQIIILKDGNYFIHKTITNGGDYLTAMIADKGNMDLIEAEEYKYKTNFFEENTQNNLCQQVKSYFEYHLTDIERTIEFFKNRNNQIGVDQIYVMGGGGLLPGLTGFMKEHLAVEVSLISDVIGPLNAAKKTSVNLSFFTHAIGATMREEWRYEL